VGVSGTGILGGSFDPPHCGHVALAREGVRVFALERLLVRVVEHPGHKDVHTDAAARLELSCLAFESIVQAEVSLDPYARTVDALEALGLDDPVFLIGADEFASFLGWKDPEGVLARARLGVATRPGVRADALDVVLASLARPDRVELFPIEPVPVSSSEIRRLVAAGRPVPELVPKAVAEAIDRLGLYAPRSGSPREATLPSTPPEGR
jgi:nicotinate-nucleotide adenylyltransferase